LVAGSIVMPTDFKAVSPSSGSTEDYLSGRDFAHELYLH
jgi:hypothetical protein